MGLIILPEKRSAAKTNSSLGSLGASPKSSCDSCRAFSMFRGLSTPSLVVDGDGFRRRSLTGKRLEIGRGFHTEEITLGRILDELKHRRRQSLRRMGRHQDSGGAAVQNLRDSSHVGGDDRATRFARLGQRQSEALPMGGQNKDVGTLEIGRRIRNKATEDNSFRTWARLRLSLELRATDTVPKDVEMGIGFSVGEPREG